MTKEVNINLKEEDVISRIYFIRGHKVMFDDDLAELYGVETRRLNEQVKRNVDRFPEDFMFQLTPEEWENLMSRFATSSWGGRRKLPYVFTEHGVLMLSSVLNSDRAIQVNILIMRAYVKLRGILNDHKDILLKLEKLETKVRGHDENLEVVFSYLKELLLPINEPMRKIGFKRSDERKDAVDRN